MRGSLYGYLIAASLSIGFLVILLGLRKLVEKLLQREVKRTLAPNALVENPELLGEARETEGRENLEQCPECGHGHLKQVPDTDTFRCDNYCGHEEHYPPVESEPDDFGLRGSRRGRGSNLGPDD